MRPRKIPQNETLRRAWLSNLTTTQIAAALGVLPTSLHYAAKKMGLPPRAAGRPSNGPTRFRAADPPNQAQDGANAGKAPRT